ITAGAAAFLLAVALLGEPGRAILLGSGRAAPDDVLQRIRQEETDRSRVQALFATLTDQFGPRLTGSPAHKQAAEWARDRMREFGLTDPKLEPWALGRGGGLGRPGGEGVAPRYTA